MAKLATLSALLLLAMVGLAAATTYTTITTTTIDEEAVTNTRGRGSERCQEQIRVQEISHCRMLVRCEGRGRHESLRMVVNPTTTTSECEEQHLRNCCNQLHNVKEECRCKTIEEMMRQGTQQSHLMMKRAQDLPKRCKMEPMRCYMQGPWF